MYNLLYRLVGYQTGVNSILVSKIDFIFSFSDDEYSLSVWMSLFRTLNSSLDALTPPVLIQIGRGLSRVSSADRCAFYK